MTAQRIWREIPVASLVTEVGLVAGSAPPAAITWVVEQDVVVEVRLDELGAGRARGPLGDGYRAAAPVDREDVLVVFVEDADALTATPELSVEEVEALCGPAVTAAMVELLAADEVPPDALDVEIDDAPGGWAAFTASERLAGEA